MKNLKCFVIALLALFIIGCGSDYSSDKTGKEVRGTSDSRINQVCVDGVLYLSTGNYVTPQQDLNGSLIGCSKKPEVIIDQLKEKQKNKDLAKLAENIKNDVKDAIKSEVKSEVKNDLKSEITVEINESIKDRLDKNNTK
ncbi:hypothetical protein [Campylobacter jejuni]|uniref:Lipoprotein n=1 Tax=Campylobacter phage CP21 TaxID=2881391 RepID=I7KIL8_9CAUD|nr:hypothetical protein [Campylobacter jejuni]YP_007005199.1 hypothetical protein F421_gp129 [Campylobacter phage CP21]QXO06321.1 hypothetical protein [Campylobacter phage CJLB-14]RTI53837.1 hypothetical protein C3I22_08485 [Campylobacter jejuni]CCH63591.1 hypothetical protein [Campylobacter phage CP21]